MIYQITFYFFAGGAALAALGLLFSRNVLYGTLFLILSLLSIAAIYVMAFAEFVAVTQILVYAGGILVVIIFGIMLTVKFGDIPLRVKHSNIFSGFLVTGPLLFLLLYLLRDFSVVPGPGGPIDQHPQAFQTIGVELLTTYVLIFEIAGVLLLIALVGAAIIASHKPRAL